MDFRVLKRFSLDGEITAKTILKAGKYLSEKRTEIRYITCTCKLVII